MNIYVFMLSDEEREYVIKRYPDADFNDLGMPVKGLSNITSLEYICSSLRSDLENSIFDNLDDDGHTKEMVKMIIRKMEPGIGFEVNRNPFLSNSNIKEQEAINTTEEEHTKKYSKEKLIERAEEALKEIREEIEIAGSYLYWKRKDAFRERKHSELELERIKADLIEKGFGEERANEISDNHDLYMTSDLYDNYFKDIDEAEEDLKTLQLDREIYKKFLKYIKDED